MMPHPFPRTLPPIALAAALSATILVAPVVAAEPPLDPSRIQALAQMLPAAPVGVGRPIADRQAWETVARSSAFRDVVKEAEQLLSQPIPELSDDLYLEFSRTGNRTRYQRVLSRRHSRLPALVLAECSENRGRFLEGIEAAIRAVSQDKTWVLPAHDRSLANFKGTLIDIDLHSSAVSWNLATADYWLGDKLTDPARKLIRSELERRCFGPFESYVATGKPPLWWATGTNNWNAVCLAGVTGAALAVIDPPERRAFYVAAAEKYIQNFLAGFTDDGYCSEGLGYWNYGFGHYVLLGETIHRATGGRVDLFDDPKVERIGRFGVRMEIVPGVYPAFADCHVSSRPDVRTMAFLSRRFGWGLEDFERQGLLLSGGPSSSLFTLGLHGFENSASQRPAAAGVSTERPLRDWFPDAGILICRPAPKTEPGLGVALKGGHNAEHHNHNDVGAFTVALAGATPLVDPGSEVYTARTFSGQRYESGVLNSFGHPVPLVAGKLQKTGRSAAAKVVSTDFTDEADAVVLDLRAAYGVEGLQQLRRTFVFSRKGAGRLTVTDDVRFAAPQSFGTALITFSEWRTAGPGAAAGGGGAGAPAAGGGPGALVVGTGPGTVRVEIDSGGRPLTIDAEKIEEDLPGGRIPTRLGINLTQPVAEASITLTITAEAE